MGFETLCALSLTPLWEALGEEEPADWSVTHPATKKVAERDRPALPHESAARPRPVRFA